MVPDRLRQSLLAVHAVAFATILRSVAYERWITVLASLALILGAVAVKRGKTWGVGVTLGAAAWFPAAFMVGIAPPWFVLVGVVGAAPFLLTSRALAQFDKTATTVGALVTTAVGAACALGYRLVAPALFRAFPSLMPSFHATNGLLLTALIAAAVLYVTSGSSRTHVPRSAGAVGSRARVPAHDSTSEGVLSRSKVDDGSDVDERARDELAESGADAGDDAGDVRRTARF